MDIPHWWPSSQKMDIFIPYVEWHALSRWDHWREQLTPLETIVYLVSLLQKTLSFLKTLSRQVDISSVVLSLVTCLDLSLPKCCWKTLGWCQVFTMKDDATGRCNGRSFGKTYPKAWTNYFKYLFCVHPLCRKAQGSQDCWSSCHEKRAHPQCSTHLTCPAGTSIPLHGSSCCPPSPPLPLFGNDLKPPQVTQWVMRLRPGFVKMMRF